MTTAIHGAEGESIDFLRELLHEQWDLTAVEQFSLRQESGSLSSEPAQARYYRTLLPATSPGPEEQYGFEVDLDVCSGCKACVVACHTLNGLEENESWRRVGTITIGGNLPQIKHVTTACHHCADPGCLRGCPVMAYDKNPSTGIVRHLDDQCIGCKYCTMMCPYDVPKYNARLGIVRKCDMCHQRLSVGEAPACVQSCPNEAIAIRLVPRNQAFSATDRLVEGAPLSHISGPTTKYIGLASSDLRIAVAQDAGVDEVEESHWPLAILLVATQASMGLLVSERISAMSAWGMGASVYAQQQLLTCAIALIAASVGMSVAPLHLGQPLRAWRVFLGLRTSWLSREVVLLGNYMLMLAVTTGLLAWQYFSAPILPIEKSNITIPNWTGNLSSGMTIIVGFAALYSSAMVYIATGRELWRCSRTMNRFLGTAVVAGLILASAVTGSDVLAILGLMSLVVKGIWEWRFQLGPGPKNETDLDRRSRRLVRDPLNHLRLVRLGALYTTGIFLGCGVIVQHLSSPHLSTTLLCCAALIALIGETSERLLYFASVVFDRMPGVLK